MTLTLVVLAASLSDLKAWSMAHVEADEIILLANPCARYGGLGAVGNYYLNRCRSDVLGLVHADTLLSTEFCRAVMKALERHAVAGIVGKRYETDEVVWSRDVPSGSTVEVSTVDSCACFINLQHELRFDVQTFDSFHLCIEDLCLTARDRGLSVVVPSGHADHWPSESGDRVAWRAAHTMYWHKLRAKWSHMLFSTT